MNNIKTARMKAGLSQKEIAITLGVSTPTVSDWESGKKFPSGKNLVKLSQVLQSTTDYLLGCGDREKAPTQKGERQAIKIPVLGSVPAGIPIEAIEDILDWEEIPASMCSGDREYFALQVQGDSMWPDYLTGDVVIIRKTPSCESGDDCVVYVNGYDATLKQVKLGEDGSLSIIPRNQNYAPKTYTAEEVRSLPVSIAGVVVELRRKVGRL